MRSEQVQTHLRCNQNCTFCTARRASDDPSFIHPRAVRERIAAAITAGAREIVLSGGEPTQRRDLEALIEDARSQGAERVVLETNATLVDDGRARALAQAGLHRVRAHLSGDAAWLDEVTRDPGGFERTLAGITALLAASIQVEVQAAVVRSTAERLPQLPALLRARAPGVRTLWLVVPVSSPDPRELLDYDSAGAVIRSVEASARRNDIALKLAPGSGPPPCVHGREAGLAPVAHLYSLTPGSSARPGHQHLAPCDECVVRERCAGIPDEILTRFGAPAMTPITTDRARRRLSLISTVQEQIARELVTPNRYRDARYGDVEEDLIRVVFQCNQACRFCFVSTHLPAAPESAIETAIRTAAARDRKICLSGGEPTLHPELPRFVALAKSLSRLPVLLQTNAIRLADRALASRLREAGLDEAFVSLHGATAEVSDEVTQAPGTFDKTVRGIDHLLEVGVEVQINFVICQANLHQITDWVELLARRWPRAFANVSFVAPSTDVVPREHALVPRYSDVLPQIAAAVARAEQHGLAIGGFESMCGIPLCLVPRALDRYFDLSDVPPGFDAGEFIKPDACARCSLSSRCYGIRRGYAELNGTAELRPVSGRSSSV